MSSDPLSVLVNSANDSQYETREALTADGKSILGGCRKQTMMDVIQVPAAGTFASTVIPPADIAIAIVGVAVENTAMTAFGSFFVEASVRGNELMGTPSLTPPTRVQISPTFVKNAGAAADTVADILPAGSNVLLANGDGSNPLWAATAGALTPPDGFAAYIYYISLDARELSC